MPFAPAGANDTSHFQPSRTSLLSVSTLQPSAVNTPVKPLLQIFLTDNKFAASSGTMCTGPSKHLIRNFLLWLKIRPGSALVGLGTRVPSWSTFPIPKHHTCTSFSAFRCTGLFRAIRCVMAHLVAIMARSILSTEQKTQFRTHPDYQPALSVLSCLL